MKRFFAVFTAYFLTLFVTASIFSYYSFGKHAIETSGFLGGSPVFNNLSDYPIFCLVSFLPPFVIAALICTLLSKKKHLLIYILIAIVYCAIWLLANTWAADGSSMDYGSTWTMYEIFGAFVLSNYIYGAPLLLGGLLSVIYLQNYLDKSPPRL